MGNLSMRLDSQDGWGASAPDAIPTPPARSQERLPLRITLPLMVLVAAATWAGLIALAVHFLRR